MRACGGRAGETPAVRSSFGPPASRRFVSIQYLRGLAALAVAAYHALQWRTGGFDVGRSGVDVFFVVSGVVMWTSTQGRPVSPGRFLARRWLRVAPLYWIATLATAASAALWPAFLPQVLPGWRHLALSLAFVPHLDPRGLPFPTLPAGWTLDYEAIFYLVFTAALFAPAPWRARLIVGALAVLVAAGFLLDDPLYILGANPMLLQFAAGVGLGVMVARRQQPAPAWGVGLFAGGVALLILVQTTGLFTEFWRPVLWGAPATLLVAGALAVEAGGRLPRVAPLRALGDASYSLYLWHPAAIAVVAHLFGSQRSGWFVPAAIAASVGAGLASHRWLERPLLARLRAR